MAISVGDATFEFLANTQNLDSAFNSVGPKATAAFKPATAAAEDFEDRLKGTGEAANEVADEVEDAGKRSAASMREAKGEAALLGEQFGIHLPRHVRTFVAELPGVGEALSAAFAATAILFVIQALDEASKKLGAFLFKLEDTSVMQNWNKELLSNADALAKVEKALADFGLSADDLARNHIAELRDAINNQSKAAAGAEITMRQLDAVYGSSASSQQAYKDAQLQFVDATNKAKIAADQMKLAIEELQKAEKDEAHKEYLKQVQAQNEADTARAQLTNRLISDDLTAQAERNKMADEEVNNSLRIERAQKEMFDAQQKEQDKAINADLSAQEARNKLADEEVNNSLKIQEAQAEMAKKTAESLAQLKKDTSITFQALRTQWMQAASPLKQLGAEGQEAFDKLTSGLQSAVAASLLSQASFGQAMEEMTRQVLASLASQALVKALFYTAEGTASVFTDPPAAAAYFEAAGLMGAVGAAAGLAAHAMSGGGGSGSASTAQLNGGRSNTSSAAGRSGSVVGVQPMAEGGLVTRPTLIMAGEAGHEAIIPLDNPRARQQMDGAGVGGGTNIHVHVAGLISPDNLTKVVEQINRRVNRGQLHLKASDSLRVTKRSA